MGGMYILVHQNYNLHKSDLQANREMLMYMHMYVCSYVCVHVQCNAVITWDLQYPTIIANICMCVYNL